MQLDIESISQNPEIFGNTDNASISSTMPAKMTGIVECVSRPFRQFWEIQILPELSKLCRNCWDYRKIPDFGYVYGR